MFITKKHITRRAVLRGAGAALALPLLDAMIPAGTALADTAASPKPHMGFIYFPHGAVWDKWIPKSPGKIEEFPEILQPLDKYKSITTVFSNLDNQAPLRPGPRALSRHLALLRSPRHEPGGARRHHRRPDRRPAHRPGHSSAFPRSGHRKPRRRRLLRSRLRLLVLLHHFLPLAYHSSPHGSRSPQAVHPLVRRRR